MQGDGGLAESLTEARAGTRSLPQFQQTGIRRTPTPAGAQRDKPFGRQHASTGPVQPLLDAVRELRAVPRYGRAQGLARSRGIARAPIQTSALSTGLSRNGDAVALPADCEPCRCSRLRLTPPTVDRVSRCGHSE